MEEPSIGNLKGSDIDLLFYLEIAYPFKGKWYTYLIIIKVIVFKEVVHFLMITGLIILIL